MSLSTDDLKQVVDYLKAHPGEWLPSHVFDLADRISNVESELKIQREIMIERFDQVDKRFEQQSRHTNRWMTAMMTLIALIGVAMTVTNVIG